MLTRKTPPFKRKEKPPSSSWFQKMTFMMRWLFDIDKRNSIDDTLLKFFLLFNEFKENVLFLDKLVGAFFCIFLYTIRGVACTRDNKTRG